MTQMYHEIRGQSQMNQGLLTHRIERQPPRFVWKVKKGNMQSVDPSYPQFSR